MSIEEDIDRIDETVRDIKDKLTDTVSFTAPGQFFERELFSVPNAGDEVEAPNGEEYLVIRRSYRIPQWGGVSVSVHMIPKE